MKIGYSWSSVRYGICEGDDDGNDAAADDDDDDNRVKFAPGLN